MEITPITRIRRGSSSSTVASSESFAIRAHKPVYGTGWGSERRGIRGVLEREGDWEIPGLVGLAIKRVPLTAARAWFNYRVINEFRTSPPSPSPFHHPQSTSRHRVCILCRRSQELASCRESVRICGWLSRRQLRHEGRRYLRENRGTDRAINARACRWYSMCESACESFHGMTKFHWRKLIRLTQSGADLPKYHWRINNNTCSDIFRAISGVQRSLQRELRPPRRNVWIMRSGPFATFANALSRLLIEKTEWENRMVGDESCLLWASVIMFSLGRYEKQNGA